MHYLKCKGSISYIHYLNYAGLISNIFQDFKCGGSFPQETRLIYEKITGLLLYVNTIGQNYHLELNLENYEPQNDTPQLPLEIPSFPILIILSIAFITTIIMITTIKKKK